MWQYHRDGLTFDVLDSGPRDGEPVLLLHGFPQDHTAWDAVTPLLHAAGLRTLAPDLRGYSPGARPRSRAAYRMGEITADLVALLDAAGLDRAHVVGHDWGGSAAWSLAGRQPQRVASLTVLSTPHPAAMLWAWTHTRQALVSWYMLAFQLPWLPERIVGPRLASSLRRSGVPAEHAQRYAARLAEPGALTAALGWYRGIPATRKERGGGGRTRVPTTYIWGRHDFALSRAAAERTAGYVAAPYEFIELDAGHWLPENEPQAVADAVVARVHSAAGPV